MRFYVLVPFSYSFNLAILYLIGMTRTLEEFEQSCGVSFADMAIQQRNWEKCMSQCGICKAAFSRSYRFVQDVSAAAIVPSETIDSSSGSEEVGVLTELLKEIRTSGRYL